MIALIAHFWYSGVLYKQTWFLIMSVLQKITTGMFIIAVIAVIAEFTWSSSRVSPSLESQVEYFEEKFLQDKAMFIRAPVMQAEEDTVTLESGEEVPALRLFILLEDDVLSSWSHKDFTPASQVELVVYSDEDTREAFNREEVLVTREAYPMHRPGWYISGHYVCVEDDGDDLTCIGLNQADLRLNDEDKTYSNVLYEFPM